MEKFEAKKEDKNLSKVGHFRGSSIYNRKYNFCSEKYYIKNSNVVLNFFYLIEF